MIKQKKIGLLGGTFDPIHNGHLHLADAIQRAWNLDEIWFIPVQINPHKQGSAPATTADRLHMVKLAIKDQPTFKLESLECERPGPSYTIDTLTALHEKYKNVSFYFILGEDAIHSLMQWKDIFLVLNAATLIVGTRPSSFAFSNTSLDPKIVDAIQKGYTPITPLDISSTEIRHCIKEGKNYEKFLPAEVFDYIKEKMLYLD